MEKNITNFFDFQNSNKKFFREEQIFILTFLAVQIGSKRRFETQEVETTFGQKNDPVLAGQE